MRIVAVVFVVLAAATPAVGQEITQPQLEAAFIINFAKLATWPALSPAAPIMLCTIGDEDVTSALALGVQTQRAGSHALTLLRLARTDEWTRCQIVFLGRDDATRVSTHVAQASPAAVLTVSNDKDFALKGGMIEFFMEGTRLRFAINLKEVHKSRVVLGSSVLQLARLVGDGHVR